jgi:hypothetical protein
MARISGLGQQGRKYLVIDAILKITIFNQASMIPITGALAISILTINRKGYFFI